MWSKLTSHIGLFIFIYFNNLIDNNYEYFLYCILFISI
ncbi:unnamed protein product [Brugia timori]|uniref:Uncharacterized protein n=1 Tax=Brugia timori TaxID=42155 RepID=A0A0R3RC68_9BILA|nr:unnamed protein product [Brugia timori]